jgi:3-oxoisoapionate decarboxylase
LKIGINQFSYHRYFGELTPWETDPGVRWSVAEFIRRAGSLKLDAVSLQTHYLGPNDLQIVKDECQVFDLVWIIEWGHPDGLKMGTSKEAVADLRRWLHTTSTLGGRLMRIVAGYPTYRGLEPVPTQVARLIPLLREASQEASDLGIVLALENHADFTPLELVDLLGKVGAPNLRATFDTGNCVRLGADLIESAQCIAPLTEIVHLKDLCVLEESRGNPNASWPSAPLGLGKLDIPGVLAVLHRQGFDGYLLIEMAHMHSSWPDEDKAVADSVLWLKTNLENSKPKPGAPLQKSAQAHGRGSSTPGSF